MRSTWPPASLAIWAKAGVGRNHRLPGGPGNKLFPAEQAFAVHAQPSPKFVVAGINVTPARIQRRENPATRRAARRHRFSKETAAIGLFRTSASALIAARPTRRPVNEPDRTPRRIRLDRSCCVRAFRAAPRSAAPAPRKTCPRPGGRSRRSQPPRSSPPAPHFASAMLPCLPEVSTARSSIQKMSRAHEEHVSRCVHTSVFQQAGVHGQFPFTADPAVDLARASFPVEVFTIGIVP